MDRAVRSQHHELAQEGIRREQLAHRVGRFVQIDSRPRVRSHGERLTSALDQALAHSRGTGGLRSAPSNRQDGECRRPARLSS